MSRSRAAIRTFLASMTFLIVTSFTGFFVTPQILRVLGPDRFGLVQALTQIQEQTLIYAPKIIAIFVSLLLFLPLMGALLGGFMREIAARIAGM